MSISSRFALIPNTIVDLKTLSPADGAGREVITVGVREKYTNGTGLK